MKIFASECIRAEPGTLMYTLVKGEDGPLGTMEIYESQEAVQPTPRRPTMTTTSGFSLP